MRLTVVKANVFWAIISQLTSIVCGFVIPKTLLAAFGSESYGLVTSISQFLNYVTLLEGGVSGVAISALYKPLQEKDTERLSQIIYEIRSFFRKLGLVCIAFTLFVAVIYPRFIETKFDYGYVFALTIVLGSRLIVQYCISISFRLLIHADQKVYYISIVQIIITVTHLILVIICVYVFDDILAVYFISGLIYLIQPLFYIRFVSRNYKIDKPKNITAEALKQKWDGFGQNLAYFIHSNTDVVLLTLFASLTDVSIYSIYLMVAIALKGLIITMSNAVSPSMGNLLAKGDIEESKYVFFKYEYAITLISFVFYTCGIELIIPFVSVYTSGIHDANYIRPLFGAIILLAELAYCVRDPYVSVAYAAGHFKETSRYAYIEAIGNIIISIVLVKKMGLTGVAIGTLISMSIRGIQQVLYLRYHILYVDYSLFFRKIFIYGSTSFFVILLSKVFIPWKMTSFVEWITYTIISFILTVIMFILSNLMFYKNDLYYFAKKVLKR